MGAPPARTGSALTASQTRGSAAAVLDFAVAQILRDESTLGALPAVLERLAALSGARAVAAFQGVGTVLQGAGEGLATGTGPILAVHPPGSVDPALLAKISAMTMAQRDTSSTDPRAAGSPVQVKLEADGQSTSALLAYSTPVGGQCLCALALIGDPVGWDEEIRAAAHAIATIVATQIRHANDLTEIAGREAALADQTERLNCLINTAIPGVLITDEQGVITHISESFGAMFGVAGPAGLVGTPAVAVIRRIGRQFADPGEFARRVIAIFRAREPISGQQIMSADGRTIECDYWPVRLEGQYRGDLWLAWDMSDRKELEQQRMQMLEAELAARQLAEQAQRQLTEQNERLRKIDEARNQFLSIVSHELRTPLTSILSFSELIRSEAGGLTPEGLSFLDIIERNADRLHRLVGDLLMLDRLEAGALPLDLAAVDIGALCLESVSAASAVATKQGITIELSAGTGPPVRGDARRLAQVLDNLIANAVKFSHRDTRVRVTAAWDARERQWRVDVADAGIGIPAAEADQLFSRFVRASNARTAGLPGTGLGLSIVKVLVELHGGHVEVDSAQGRGSTFSVYLPVPSDAGSPA